MPEPDPSSTFANDRSSVVMFLLDVTTMRVLAPSRRHDNVRHAFAIEPVDLTGHEVVLIDDVKTSGATLAACTKLLKQAGATSVHAAVIAVADPKGNAFSAI